MRSTLVDVLRSHAQERPDHCAYVFIDETSSSEYSLTYAELDHHAQNIAAVLQEHFVPGERALLLYPPGLEFISAFFGCLYAGIIAVPLYPPHGVTQHRSYTRLQTLAADARPACILSTKATQAATPSDIHSSDIVSSTHWYLSDLITQNSFRNWSPPAITGSTLAFLQYTSGSTTTPRGVMVSHANIVSNLFALDQSLRHTANSRYVSWLPHFHDMGLIYGILQPLYHGIPCTLLAPAAFAQQPRRWLQAITRYGATHSAAPNVGYDLCIQKIKEEDTIGLDLQAWASALSGAEPIRPATLTNFAEQFRASGFRAASLCPGYGLAEATLAVALTPRDRGPVLLDVCPEPLTERKVVLASPDDSNTRSLVSCGRIVADTTVEIVDPDTCTLCPSDRIGEIWVTGPGVAQGYWERAEDTAVTFHASIADTSQGPFLRTGDLGFMHDGELYVTGRLKDMIIIDGRNHYPQDLEQTVETCHPAMRPNCCAVFSIERNGAEHIVVVGEIERRYRPMAEAIRSVSGFYQPLDPNDVVRAVRRAVAEEHELFVADVVLLRVGSIAKTSSGKIQRQSCRMAYLAGTLSRWGHQ